ncbi:hypothetical protein LCGC14_1101990 [marine sediment metagenome]|uniref:Shikimate kinase n=1 Tax=marine sediment metagenome TaxID=412755 RepID=A0A0F9QFF0_9ZZZZ
MVISAFCGTGKSYLCEQSFDLKYIEFECWKYDQSEFPSNYVTDVLSRIGEVDIIFVSTNPMSLNLLIKSGVKVILIYPELQLKDEYLSRYINRCSSYDFIKTLSTYWEIWIRESMANKSCQHVVLTQGQYISDVLSQFIKESK